MSFQERTGSNSYDHNNLTLQYKLDNEFELIFVVAFQKILQLAYVDKFLSDVHLEFRDKYKNELTTSTSRNYYQYDFLGEFQRILESAEDWGLYYRVQCVLIIIHVLMLEHFVLFCSSFADEATKANEIVHRFIEIEEDGCIDDRT